MKYEEALDFLMNNLPMYQRVGNSAFKKNLDNTLKLCSHLGNPQNRFKSIHIAGTNGKGSSAHLLASVLQASGYKTGLYTSPHLKNFTERIKINGDEINRARVTSFVEDNETFLGKLKPSFFEMTVAMAFDHFAREEVDFAVIETGLGGRLDSTNVIAPIVSLITNISYDHMDMLGNTLEDIAREKAGIIKGRVPVVIGEKKPPLDSLFREIASKKESDIYFSDDEVQIDRLGDKIHIRSEKTDIRFVPDLRGTYQLKNLPGVVKTCEVLRDNGVSISDKYLTNGLENTVSNTGLKGRWQILDNKPLTICDAAHNTQGLNEIVNEIQRINKKTTFVLGFTREKNIQEMMALFPKDARYYFTQASIPRAMDVYELQDIAEKSGIQGIIEKDVNKALKLAKDNTPEDGLVFVGGSIFVIAELDDL